MMRTRNKVLIAVGVVFVGLVIAGLVGEEEAVTEVAAPTTTTSVVVEEPVTTTTAAPTTTTVAPVEAGPDADSSAGRWVAAARALSIKSHDPIGLTDWELVGLFMELCGVYDSGADVAVFTQVFIDTELVAEQFAAELAEVTVTECGA